MLCVTNLREYHMPKLDTNARNELAGTKFAFPKQRKEPIENATHVRNAAARFSQVEGATDSERDAAWRRIKAAATKFGVTLDRKPKSTK